MSTVQRDLMSAKPSTVSEVQCPLCGSGSKSWYPMEHAHVIRCVNPGCGLGYLVEQPSDEQLTGYYREYYYPSGESEGPVFENSDLAKMEQHFLALEERVGIAGKQILDYGCGVGNFMEVAREHGCTAMGIEYDDEGRATASEKGFRVEKTIEPYEESLFDFVYMNDVIEHLRDPVEDLRQLHARMKPGTAAFIVTMNMRGLKPKVVGDKWDVITNPTHLWFYDEQSLGKTLEAAGFARWTVERFKVDFTHHGVLRRNLQRMLQKLSLDASLRVLAWRGDDE
jgi:2-polyprenyl-3-methyl-5-hydroxy-6-metoxy-1,4-benzoquinol methylase